MDKIGIITQSYCGKRVIEDGAYICRIIGQTGSREHLFRPPIGRSVRPKFYLGMFYVRGNNRAFDNIDFLVPIDMFDKIIESLKQFYEVKLEDIDKSIWWEHFKE